MPGVDVDGQDVLAVYGVAGAAIDRARAGAGPTLIECRTYRYVGHHEGDPGTDYRTREEIAAWKKRDPLELFARRLVAEEEVSPATLDGIEQEVSATVAAAVEFAEDSPWPAAEGVRTNLFAS
jgi:pyruvate dehydrogenase E1 component alpha subunit